MKEVTVDTLIDVPCYVVLHVLGLGLVWRSETLEPSTCIREIRSQRSRQFTPIIIMKGIVTRFLFFDFWVLFVRDLVVCHCARGKGVGWGLTHRLVTRGHNSGHFPPVGTRFVMFHLLMNKIQKVFPEVSETSIREGLSGVKPTGLHKCRMILETND